MQKALIDKMGTGKSDVQVMIEKDKDNGVYIFTFAASNGWHDIYEMVGRFYLGVGEDHIESYEVDKTSNKWAKLLIVKVPVPWTSDEKEMGLIHEILNHWFQIERWKTFSFCPVNFDLTLTSYCQEDRKDNLALKNSVPDYFKKVDGLWGQQNKKLEVKAGEVVKYEISYRMD
ncbi:MAG TPA: hypothetical protein V6D21_05260 [Candidatus Obscuribacterales bacterium]